MYIDETIVLDKNLQTELLRDFQVLGKYYEAGDWLNFDLLFEVVEVSVKSNYLNGRISNQDLENIFRKYKVA
ncbi:hypothetical protein BLA28_32800 [Eisenbergiella tayi]|uniref:Uncharacterized protein n=1 Tax=Eisenbergiella tayi TaxID=1432052 RepID=A0A1E3ARN4_9FIRM|nr:hypothetical protein [Eisenbergiella tayi]ODM11387.1 hypothetical protein BEH84_01996 [Eisenbergiella tayi]OIZ59159.1 hypothetical protein BLA28_32800 [Eisenbergiella tayi]